VGAEQGTFQSGQVGSTANQNANQLDAQRQQLDQQRQILMQDQTQLNANQRRTMGRGVTGALDQAEPANPVGASGLPRGNAAQYQNGMMQRGINRYGARGYANQPQYNTGYRGTNQQTMGAGRAVLGIDLDGRYPHAAVVGRVHPGGGAGMAGLMPGDTIWSVNNLPINSSQDLMAAVSRLQPGEIISVGFTRPSNVQIRLGARPGQGLTAPGVTPTAPPATEGTLGAPPLAPPAEADEVRPTSGALNAGPAPPRTTAGRPGQGVDADAISTGPTPEQ
jgi:PDZ domain